MGCCSSTAADPASGDQFVDLHDAGDGATARPKSVAAQKASRYAAADEQEEGDSHIDMDAHVASMIAASPAAVKEAHSGDDDNRPSPAPPAPAPVRPNTDPSTLVQTEEELEEARRRRLEAREEGGLVTKTMEIFFDDDRASEEMLAPGDEEAVVQDFSAALPSPSRNNALDDESKVDAVPRDEWFAERGVLPPQRVVWYQSSACLFVEIAPANDGVGYELSDGYRLCYNCGDEPPTPPSQGDVNDTDIILYTTSTSCNTITKQHCRDMERMLYLHKLHAHTMDIGEHGFMRKTIIKLCGDKDLGLPLLFVGERLIGTSEQVQLMIDEGKFLSTLGESDVVPRARKAFDDAQSVRADADKARKYWRVELALLDSVEGVSWSVVHSPTGSMLTMRAEKVRRPRYWNQLIRGSPAEVRAVSWIQHDLSRDEDDDDEDTIAGQHAAQ